MKKELIGLSICILLIAVTFTPVTSAENEKTISDVYDDESTINQTSDPETLGFSAFGGCGPLGLKVFAQCNKYDFNSLSIEWEMTEGRLYRVIGPLKLKEKVSDDGWVYTFVYWFFPFGNGEFNLHYICDSCTRTITGKLHGAYVRVTRI